MPDNRSMIPSSVDQRLMMRALQLAHAALYITSPNPRVGCVLANTAGDVLGEGHTQVAGQAHAEVMALADARARGHDPRGAIAYVTLEPCAHHGRTGPCCEALTQAGVSRVVLAETDPNPLVSGRGVAHLRTHGVQVDVGLLAEQSRELNLGFFKRMTTGRPWVRMKIAASLDGQTALPDGQSQWITGPEARADGHAWRARACAILSGHGTVKDDDPLLDVRAVQTPRQPALVLVDSRLQTPSGARLWGPKRAVWIYGAQASNDQRDRLCGLGADVRCLPNDAGKVDLPALIDDLGARGVNELHIEAGHKLNGSLLRAALVDELLIYLAPKMLGSGRGMAELGVLQRLEDALGFEWMACDRVGADLRLRARRA
jgi:diaminohydroxyphosphoribosylaminopyrimidine deaminase / 5-amino-6-(5-phosphoribosylamino)uracil reductase